MKNSAVPDRRDFVLGVVAASSAAASVPEMPFDVDHTCRGCLAQDNLVS